MGRWTRWQAAVVVASALCGGGCGSGAMPTLVIEVSSDVPQCEMGFFHLRCAYDWDGASARSVPMCDVRQPLGAGERYPLRYRLVEREPSRPLTVVMEGRVAEGLPVVLRRTVLVRFDRTGRALVIPVSLSRECARTATAGCPSGASACRAFESCEARASTCGAGACRAREVREGELVSDERIEGLSPPSCAAPLPALDGGPAGPADASARDANVDSNRDARAADASAADAR